VVGELLNYIPVSESEYDAYHRKFTHLIN